MQKKARSSIIDTILGEAVYGSPQARYADMLGIASVISNRATLANVSPDEIVSAPGQFNAYGKSLPKGVEAHRALAEQAWNQVQTIGPVTSATYYSTPAAAKNLPGGLQQVDETTGHVYSIDPENRAFATAKGFVTPAVDLVASVAQKANETARAVATGAINVAQNVGQSLGLAEPTSAVGPDEMAGNITPDMAGRSVVSDTSGLAGKGRYAAPESRLQEEVAKAVGSVYGPNATVSYESGTYSPEHRAAIEAAPTQRERRALGEIGSHRHTTGFAGDFDVLDATGRQSRNNVAMRDVALNFAAANPNAGIGYGQGYMTPGRMHLDLSGMGGAWGANNSSANLNRGLTVGPDGNFVEGNFAENIDFAREQGLRGSDWRSPPAFDAPTPFGRNEANPNSLRAGNVNTTPAREAYAQAADTMRAAGIDGLTGSRGMETYAAPSGVVERGGALAPARENPANRNAFDTMRAGMDNPTYGPGQTVPAGRPTQRASYAALEAKPSAPSAPNVASAYADMGRSMQAAGVSPSPQTQPAGPTTADLASAYGQMGAGLSSAGIANLSGAPLSAPQQPSLEQVAQVSLPELPATQVNDYKIAPPQEVPTVQAPTATPTVATPQATTVAAPTAQAKPKSKVQQRVVGALVGGLLGGLPGAAIGGLMGPTVANGLGKMGGLGGMFGGPPDVQRSNYGSGLAAMSDVLGGGGYTGATAYSRSTPGYSVTNLGNGWVEKTNQYGVKSYDFTGFKDSLFGGKSGSSRGDRSLSREVSDAIDRGSVGLY